MNDLMKSIAPYAIASVIGGVIGYATMGRYSRMERVAFAVGGALAGAGAVAWWDTVRGWTKEAITDGSPDAAGVSNNALRPIPREAQPISNAG